MVLMLIMYMMVILENLNIVMIIIHIELKHINMVVKSIDTMIVNLTIKPIIITDTNIIQIIFIIISDSQYNYYDGYRSKSNYLKK